MQSPSTLHDIKIHAPESLSSPDAIRGPGGVSEASTGMGMGSLSLHFTLFPTIPFTSWDNRLQHCNRLRSLLPLSCLVLPVEAKQQKAPDLLRFLGAGPPKTDLRHGKGECLSACFVASPYYQSSWDQLHESHF